MKNLWTKIKGLWVSHGTKLIGGVTAAIGAVAALDPAVIVTFLTAIFGDRGPGYAVTVGGLLTLYRGFKNSKSNAAPPQP